ncbi:MULTISPECIES: hypothetical protein [Hungatella]|uniref:hypothetical protein n=1 Tax=Hungatella TaxID=1649459 RepID=UPI002672D0F7|nr:hypothetical protein [Hungatella hathewayi]
MNILYSITNQIKLFRNNPFIETLSYYIFFLFLKATNKEARGKRYTSQPLQSSANLKHYIKEMSDLNIAIISDEMTYENFSFECHLYSLTPHNWIDIFSQNQIDIFFCESTWEGRKKQKQCWRGRIYKNHDVYFESRKDLFKILAYCKSNQIPTVFWNKEDPTYYGSHKYDFVDTALYFDYIFTTAEECIEMYQKRGHKNVYLMTFGFSPYLYNPLGSTDKEKKAIFAGSWFAEQTHRCNTLSALLHKILNQHIPLDIYDRQSSSRQAGRRYPEEFQKYVQPSIPQSLLGKKIKHCYYAININTVIDSTSMFARRVYELMASNVYIISGESIAMDQLLKGRYAGLSDPIPDNPFGICRDNVNYVFRNHTNSKRLATMLRNMGSVFLQPTVHIAICSSLSKVTVTCDDKTTFTIVDNIKRISRDMQYFIIWNKESPVPLDNLLPHFSYISDNCGIRICDLDIYQYTEDTNNQEVLFPIKILDRLKIDIGQKTKKYHI